MKRTLALALAAGIIFAGSRSNAQDFSYSLYYDFQTQAPAAVVTTRVTTLTNVFGNGFSLDVDAFGGVNLKNSAPVAGFMVVRRAKAADNLTVFFGPGVSVSNGQPVGFGVCAGFTLRF